MIALASACVADQNVAAAKMATVLAWLVRPKRRVCMGSLRLGIG